MSLTYEQLIYYVQKTAIDAQSTNNEAIAPNKNKKNQTTFAFRYTRQLLEQLTSHSNNVEISELLNVISDIPINFDLRLLANVLKDFSIAQEKILTNINNWLESNENSKENIFLYLEIIKALHFLLLTIENDIEINKPNQDKIAFHLVTLIRKEDKPIHYNTAINLKEKCITKYQTLEAQAQLQGIKKRAYPIRDKTLESLSKMEGELLSEEKNKIINATKSLQRDLPAFENELQSTAKDTNRLKKIFEKLHLLSSIQDMKTFWQSFADEDDFHDLMDILQLSPKEKENWQTAYQQQYGSILKSDFYKGWIRYVVSFTNLIQESVLTFTEVMNQLNHNTVIRDYCDEALILTKSAANGLTISEKINHAYDQILTFEAELNTTKEKVKSLRKSLIKVNKKYLTDALNDFIKSRSLIIYFTSHSYRVCYKQVQFILFQLEIKNIDEGEYTHSKQSLKKTFDTFGANAWIHAKRKVNKFINKWSLFVEEAPVHQQNNSFARSHSN